MERKFIEFTAETNAIDYLSKVPQFLNSAQMSRKDWKWVIVSLHGAIYGFAICAAQGSDPSLLSTKTKRGIPKLKTFDQILDMCKNPALMRSEHGRTELIIEDKEQAALKSLKNEVRNNFEHFSPMNWYLSEALLLEITENSLNVIEKLHPKLSRFCFLSNNQHRQIKSYIYQSRKMLKSFPRRYTSK